MAYRQLLERNLNNKQRLIFIGAGTTIEAMAGNLIGHNFQSIKIFNRTLEKAQKLASVLNGEGYALQELTDKCGEFDIIITCTGAEGSIIDHALFEQMLKQDSRRKTIVDLAIPNDIDPAVVASFDVDYIAIETLKEEAKRNLKEREKEIFRCEALVEQRLAEFEDAFRTRKLELAMQSVPQMMKEIKVRALDKTFTKDIEKLDPESKDTLYKILNYLEKKYISIPMKMAKQVILDQDLKDPIIE